MDWQKVWVLLQVAKQTLDFPKLKPLHDAAVATLEGIDPNDLHAGPDAGEPLEDE